MKKILNILLILLLCLTVSVSAEELDQTDNTSCDPNLTYYNFYFFNAAEHLNVYAHDDYSRPYDFFQNKDNTYTVSCAGAINIKSSDGKRTQTVVNPSTCSGSIDGFSLNTWTIPDFWTQVENITMLHYNPSWGFDGWTPNKENYSFKKIGNEEIRLIIPGSSSSTWNGATYQEIPGINYAIGEVATLLPKTEVDLYFGQPTYNAYNNSLVGTSLQTTYNGKSFKGSNTAKKFVVRRAKPGIPSTAEPCNSENSPGNPCKFEYFSPVMYVVKYKCSGKTTTPPCDPETACCYEKKETPVNAYSNALANSCKNPLYRFANLGLCAANDAANALTGSAGTVIDGNYRSDFSGEGEGKYTYTANGRFNGEFNTKSSNLILTECVQTCDPLTQCCYVRNLGGLSGFLNIAEESSGVITDIINKFNNKTGLNTFLSGMRGLFGDNFSGATDQNILENATSAASALIDQALGGSGAAAQLKYQYTPALPDYVNTTVKFADGGSKVIKVSDTTMRYRLWKILPDGTRERADLTTIAPSDAVEMESCGCNPERQCCYDSTGLTYNGYAGELENAEFAADGSRLSEHDKARIETYALVPMYDKGSAIGEGVKNVISTIFSRMGDSSLDVVTKLISGFSQGLSPDNIKNTLYSAGTTMISGLNTDTPLLEAFKGLPEYKANGELNKARAIENSLFKVAQASWPPVISGFTKEIYDKQGHLLAVKSCGCDEEKECCYDDKGNYHYDYRGYNEIKGVGVDSSPHYQRLELNDNPYYNENRDRGLISDATGKLQEFMNSTTKDVVKCKAYHISLDYVCTQDDYQEISSGQFVEAETNRVDNDGSGNENRTTDSWMKVLSRGGQTGVGYSIIPESMRSLRYRGLDIVCADAYKVTYPGVQDSGEKGQFIAMSNNNAYLTYNVDYDNKTAATKAPIVKIELKKTCVSTKGLSQRTFNPEELISNQANYLAQHAFFKNYLNYANLFGIDLDERQTANTARRQQIADNLTTYFTTGTNPVVKARLYYDDYTTAFKDQKGFIDLDLKVIKCPNIHKEFIEYNVDNSTGKRKMSDLGIYCADSGGYEIPNSDDTRATPVYACSDTNLAGLQNVTGDNYFERMWAQCVAVPFTDEYEDTENPFTVMGQKLETLWYDFLNGEWTVKDFYTKTETVVLYGTIPQTLVKGGTALTCMQGYCEDNPFDSEVVSLPNNSLPIGFDTTSGNKRYRIEVDIDMTKTRKMPTFDGSTPTQIPDKMWGEWKTQAAASPIRDYGKANYDKNQSLVNKANVINPAEKKTVSSDGYVNDGNVNTQYTCSYSVDDELGNANYFYRTISLSNVNPQGRKLGSNWNYSNLNASTGKYKGLIKRIDSQRALTLVGKTEDESYNSLFKQADNNYQVLTGNDKFTFKLTANTMRRIRSYNKLKMYDFSGTDEPSNSTVGNPNRRGYSDWTLNVVDYNGEASSASDQDITIFNNTDASTKWIVGLEDTSSAANVTIPDYVYRRYNSQDNYTGYHWYSPFLWCLYYGNEYCTDVTPPVQSIKYDDAKIKNDIKNTFVDYEPISNQSDEWDLRANVKKLILKQNKIDNESFKAVTTTTELAQGDPRTTVVHLGSKHEPTLIDFTTMIGGYVVEFGGLLIGVDTSGLVNAGGSVLGKLIGAATGTGYNPWNSTVETNESAESFVKGIGNAIGDWFQSGLFGDLINQIAQNAANGN